MPRGTAFTRTCVLSRELKKRTDIGTHCQSRTEESLVQTQGLRIRGKFFMERFFAIISKVAKF